MVVTVNASIGDGNFQRYQGERDKKDGGAVGTFSIDMQGVGDSGGGTVTLNLQASRTPFGFRAALVPIAVSVQVTTDPGNVFFSYSDNNNFRLDGAANIQYASDLIQVGSEFFLPEQVVPRVGIEPVTKVAANVFTVRFTTNTDATVYHLHMFGIVFDRERMAKHGAYGPYTGALTG